MYQPHKRTRRLLAGSLTTGLLLAPLAVSTPAMAAHKPHHHKKTQVTFAVAGSATAGQPTSFSWAVKHFPKKARLVLQRQEGTAKVWHTIAKLPHVRQGNGQVPALALGDYKVRLAVTAKKHQLVAQRSRTIRVFGQVPFSALFPDHEQGAYSTRSFSFTYYVGANAGDSLEVTGANNHCDYLSVDYVPGYDDSTGATGIASVVQGSRDPVSSSALVDHQGSLSTPLVPGQPWALRLSQAGGYVDYFYVNGYALCDTSQPLTYSWN